MNNDIIIATSNYNTIKNICQDVHLRSKMVSIIGYPGAGKTTALTDYCNKNKNVFFVKVTASMNAKQFYTALIQSMKENEKLNNGSLHDMINKISHSLNYDTEKKLLIIDEAGKFKPKFLEYLHELRDNTELNTGVILAGPDYFYNNMLGWKNKNVIGVPELYRRINHWEFLDKPTLKEIRAFCEIHEIKDDVVITNIINSPIDNYSDIMNEIKNYHYQISK